MVKKFLLLCVGLFFLQNTVLALTLTSNAFKNNLSIPALYTCEGKDVSPELSWSDVPANTKSFALIVTDIDAPVAVFDHWVIFNLPAHLRHIKENQQDFSVGVMLGNNTWGSAKYRGPCPPTGEHRYYFTLYALDINLGLDPGSSKAQLESAMQGHVLGKAELMGRYKKAIVE